jgi:hypothetical protein
VAFIADGGATNFAQIFAMIFCTFISRHMAPAMPGIPPHANVNQNFIPAFWFLKFFADIFVPTRL